MCSQNFLAWLINERSLSELRFTPHKTQGHEVRKEKHTEKTDYKKVQRYRVSINLNLNPFRT